MSAKPTYKELEQQIETLKEELAQSNSLEADFHNFFELSPDIIGSGNIGVYFSYVNDSFKKTLGYAKTDLYKRPFTDFIHPDDVKRTEAAIEEAMNGKRNIYIENRYRLKDGSY